MSSLTTSGTWLISSGQQTPPPNPQGDTTSKLSWSAAPGGARSALSFAGTATTGVLTDAAEFTVGTITFDNTAPLVNPVVAEVSVTGAFDGGLVQTFVHSIGVKPGEGGVSVLSASGTSSATVSVEGAELRLILSGIRTEQDGLVQQLHVPAGASRTFELRGYLGRANTADVRITAVNFKGTVKKTQSDEYVELVNRGAQTAVLTGWVMSAGDRGQQYTFPATELATNALLRVYTNETHPESGGHSFASKSAIFNDKGDTARLHDGQGLLVTHYGYGDEAPTTQPVPAPVSVPAPTVVSAPVSVPAPPAPVVESKVRVESAGAVSIVRGARVLFFLNVWNDGDTAVTEQALTLNTPPGMALLRFATLTEPSTGRRGMSLGTLTPDWRELVIAVQLNLAPGGHVNLEFVAASDATLPAGPATVTVAQAGKSTPITATINAT